MSKKRSVKKTRRPAGAWGERLRQPQAQHPGAAALPARREVPVQAAAAIGHHSLRPGRHKDASASESIPCISAPEVLPGLGMGPSGSACRGRSRRAQGQRLALHPQQPWGHHGHRCHRRLRARTPLGQEGSPAVTGEGRAGAGNRMTPSLTPQPLQPPKSISSSPFSILMNRKGSWDPWRQQPWRLDPPKE